MDTANKILAESTPIKPYFEIKFFIHKIKNILLAAVNMEF